MKEWYEYTIDFVGGGLLRTSIEAFTLADAMRQVKENEHELLCKDEVVKVTIGKVK